MSLKDIGPGAFQKKVTILFNTDTQKKIGRIEEKIKMTS